MTTSTNLGITLLEVAQSDKEGSINTSINTLDESICSMLIHDMASDADYTLLESEKHNIALKITDTSVVLTTTRNIILPDNKQLHIAINNTAQSLIFKTAVGTGVTVASTAIELIYCDGTNIISVSSVSQSGISYDIMQYYPGKPGISATVSAIIMPRTVEFLTDMSGSYAKSLIAATTSTDFTIKKNGASIGTLNFAAASNTGTFTLTNTIFSSGDILTIEAPASQDSTLSDVYITLVGFKYI